MAKDKKSFLLYCDLIDTVKELTDVQAGKLFKHTLEYVNDLDPKPTDPIVKILFPQIKNHLKRDLIKWENIANRNRVNGLKGGRPPNPEKPKEPSGLSGNPEEPKKAVSVIVSDTVSVTDSVNVNDNVIEENNNPAYAEILDPYPFEDFWNHYDKKTSDKRKCKKKYNKLNDKEKEQIFATLENYKQSTPDKQFRKSPETYLNQKGWEHEIIDNGKQPTESIWERLASGQQG